MSGVDARVEAPAVCEVCGKEPAARAGLGWRCIKRRQRWEKSGGRSTPMGAPVVEHAASPEEQLELAALRLADHDAEPASDRSYRDAQRRHRDAALAYACSKCQRCRTGQTH